MTHEEPPRPIGTVKYLNQEEKRIYSEDPEQHPEIMPYSTEDFTAEWVSTDAWRGYYKVKAAADDWEKLHSDSILHQHHSEKELKEFDDRIREIGEELGVEIARVTTQTSNVFSSSYDLFIKGREEDIEELKDRVERL